MLVLHASWCVERPSAINKQKQKHFWKIYELGIGAVHRGSDHGYLVKSSIINQLN